MTFTTLITPDQLMQHLDDPAWAVVDCRFVLQQAEQGRHNYQQSHIAGAVYAHLDEDLASPIIPGQTGRHPLPDAATFARTLSQMGIDNHTQVVAYDDMGGALAAARLWWLLRWLGHESVAVLDGGWQAWQSAGYPMRDGSETRPARRFAPQPPRQQAAVTTSEVLQYHTDPAFRLIDVRKPERYRGEVEPMDPVAGHIPGAISVPYETNLGPDGRLLPVAELRARYQALLADTSPENCIFYCGSGVTSAQSVLALVHAGLGEARLYIGSWSEWCSDPARPAERG